MVRYSPEETAAHKQKFLDHYLEHGSVRPTLTAIGFKSWNTFKYWVESDKEFEAEYKSLKEQHGDILEGQLHQLARGLIDCTQRQLIALLAALKAHFPDKYIDILQTKHSLDERSQKAIERLEKYAELLQLNSISISSNSIDKGINKSNDSDNGSGESGITISAQTEPIKTLYQLESPDNQA